MKLEVNKKEIQDLGLNAIRDFFRVNINQIDKNTIKIIHDRAKLGMSFEREMNLTKRAVEMNYLKVFKLVAVDKKELKKYIKHSMPHYLPLK